MSDIVTHNGGAPDYEAQRDAEEDAALDRILGGEGDPDAPVVFASRDADDSDAPADDGPADTADAEATDDRDGKGDTLPDDLMRALRRDNVPQAVLDSTDADTLRGWAEAARKRQADVDAFSERMKALEQRASGLDDTDGGEPSADAGSEEAEQAGNQPGADSDDAATHAASRFRELFGEEAAEPMEAMVAQVTALEQQVNETKQAAVNQQQQAEVAWAVADLAMQRPGLDGEQVKAVLSRAQAIAKERPGAFGSYSDMLAEAARDVLGAAPSERGGPTPPARERHAKPALTQDEYEDRVLDGLLSGMSADEAVEAARA